eukprot:7939419-Pyramimonas_sp.AAC.1
MLPAYDWSIVGICPCFLRLIGPSWEYTIAACEDCVGRALRAHGGESGAEPNAAVQAAGNVHGA